MNAIDNTSAEVDQIALRKELVARAAEIVPLLRSNGPKADADRRLPEASVEAMTKAGLFRICSPREYGGYGGDVRTYMDVVSEIGRGCGSASWIAFISNATAWIAGLLPEQTRGEIFEGNPDARIVCVLAPTAKTTRVEGGYKVSGRWSFASGCYHGDWAYNAAPVELEDGSTEIALLLMPMSETTIEDTWYSVGVRGSGSNTVIADDLFVPDHRVQLVSGLTALNAMGDPEREAGFRQAFAVTALIVVAAPIIGMARAALDLTRERLAQGNKAIAYSTYRDSRKSPAMQLLFAEGASLINTGNKIVQSWCDRIVEAATAKEELSYEERAALRSDVGLAVRNCREGVDRLLSVHGASAFAEVNPIQRVWRDIETGSRHGLLSPEVPMEIYGRALMGEGESPDLSNLV